MRKRMLLINLFLALSMVLSACGVAAYAQSEPTDTPAAAPRILNVTGNGRAYLTPDIAHISIGVHTEGQDAAEAVAENTAKSQEVAAAMEAFDIASRDIQTSNFSIYPQQEYDREGNMIGIRYLVDNTVYVTVRDLDVIGDLLDGVVKAGANSINNIQFDVADRTAALSEARQAAVADARQQAEELAEAAGVELGPIQSINAYGSDVPVPVAEGRSSVMMVEVAAAIPVSTGQLVLDVAVNLVYEIR